MKSRRVFVTLELNTDIAMRALSSAKAWNYLLNGESDLSALQAGELASVLQASANVAQQPARKPARRKEK